jgi:Domain of unknown function (DUF4091)
MARLVRLLVAATLVALVASVAASARNGAAKAGSVTAYPSSAAIRGTGSLPAGGSKTVSLNAANGESEDAILVASGAQNIQVAAPTTIGPLPVKLYFGHFVSFGGTKIPDALLPWDGSARAAEQPNQPVWLKVTVPYGTPAGTYSDVVGFTLDGGAPQSVKVSVRVYGFALPQPGDTKGALMTAFNVSAETYVNTVSSLNGLNQSEQRHIVNPTLYRFLSEYRISPNSWGFGAPTSPSGYTTGSAWFRSPATNMTEELSAGPFAAMSVPVSNNRTSKNNWIAGLDPLKPSTWCDYLKSVQGFWQQHGWTSSLPYLYGLDETGTAGFKVVQQQAASLHSCFAGAKELVTGNPTANNKFLWNGGSDDVDIWTVLGARFYGKYTNPAQSRQHISHAHDRYSVIQQVRSHGKQIWTYNYANTKTPGFQATEPLSDPHMFFLWAALEGIQGVLYGENMTAYKDNPLDAVASGGEFVLLYPGLGSPDPSARLEQIRDGIEDWEILNAVRARKGAGAVRALLGGQGLFSATAAKVQLGCTIGCDLKSSTPFAWPLYSHDATTPGRIEKAKAAALSSLG